MSDNSLKKLHDAGVSLWLDYIDRTMLRNGDLQKRINEESLTGMTSNPTIFEKALAEGSAYDDQVKSAEGNFTAMELFELVETSDVRDACDIFRPVYDATKGEDGYVSIEVSPGGANDATATFAEAERLWATVDRPNVMIKIPGTVEGAKAVRQCIAAGINVNITLLFAIDAYKRVSDAYMDGLEDRVKAGKDISTIHSVASFFVSRVDSEIDKRLDAAIQADANKKATLDPLHGKAAIANAQLAYELFQKETASPRWKALEAKGASLQRPLWASTSTKNKTYNDVMYVEELIGPHTVNTMPPATIVAFKDHGKVERSVDQHYDAARKTIADLDANGITMNDVTDKLLAEGLASFQKSFDTLLAGLRDKTKKLGKELVAS
ncbi:MAG TPA: transaldolase [Gemmatimonadaceae bacterium]|jgi:transaldolase